MIITQQGTPVAAIVLPKNSHQFFQFIGEELKNWIHSLTGAWLPVYEADQLPDKTPFISVAGAGWKGTLPDTENLLPEGFIIASTEEHGCECILCLGKDEAGCLYAAYELLGLMGVVFGLVETIVPEQKPDLEISGLKIEQSPEIAERGYMLGMITAPWIGFSEFKNIIDQMARMKLNHLMVVNGIGSPVLDIEVRGEKNLLGDHNAVESGYLAWRCSTNAHTVDEMDIGQELFSGSRACATEFQHVQTSEEAKSVANNLLNRVIDYAHSRKVKIGLGVCDMPCVPINLSRHRINPMHATPWYGAQPSPSEPIVEETWSAILEALLTDYPEADSLWLWISEAHRSYADDRCNEMAAEFREKYGQWVKPLEAIKEAGMWRPTSQKELDSDFAYLHLAERLLAETRDRFPSANLGIAWCGRLYLFDAMDKIFPKDISFLSLEASTCWCREKRVPMEWGMLEDRKTWITPRLDDDVNTFGPQWNIELYQHDRVLAGSREFGFTGVLPQVCSRFRGLEHNASYFSKGYWNTEITQEEFYSEYSESIFGSNASEKIAQGFNALEEFERFLGRDARVPHGGISYFSGLMNFVMYYDSPEIRTMTMFRDLKQPFEGPRFPGNWDVGRYKGNNSTLVKSDVNPSHGADDSAAKKTNTGQAMDLTAFEGYDHLHGGDDGKFLENCIYRLERFKVALPNLRKGRACFESARSTTNPGSQNFLEYMIHKIRLFERHIEWVCRILQCWLAMDRAFALKAKGERIEMRASFDEMMQTYDSALGLLHENVRIMAQSNYTNDPSEKYTLFRYHTRYLNTTRAFRPFLSNLRNFHHGEAPYWQRVDWDKIRLINWMDL